MGDAAIELRGVRKAFGDTVAVEGTDLTVPTGAFFGLVGRNGAGKSTTLRMTTGLLRPDAGDIVVAGHDVWADPQTAKAAMGVMTDDVQVFDHLTGAEFLLYVGMLRGMDRDLIVERSRELLTVMELDDAASRYVNDYSHGMTKKVILASALLHAPPVVFLDEPFEGVDPVSTQTLETVLQRYVEGGGTVVFSSHVLDVVERLCDHVAMMDAGRIVASGTIDAIRGGGRLQDAFLRALGATGVDEEALSWLQPSSD
ncbi:MAG: ABC transporter ATP-binding protein [Actinomycetota bacterium]